MWGGTMRQQIQFLKHFLRNPNKVGAITALNEQVGEALVKYIRQAKTIRPLKVLEVGAGYGNISKIIVKELKGQDTLDIVEVDKKCCEHVENIFHDNKHVNIHCKSILKWSPNYQYDFIISTLPFNSYAIEFVQSVIERYENICAKGAILSYVEYSGLMRIRNTFSQGEKKSMIKIRKEFLDSFKDKFLIEKKRIINNIPPCNVYHLKMPS